MPSPPRSRRTWRRRAWPARRCELDAAAQGLDLIRLAAALLERDAAQMRFGESSPDEEQAVTGEQRDVGVADRGRGRARVIDVVDRAVVLVHQRDRAAAEARRLVEARRDPSGVRPQRREVRMVVHRDVHVVTQLVHFEVQLHAGWVGPPTFEQRAVDVDAHDVVGSELVPQEEPRVAEQRAVGLFDGDVPGEMVVVALAEQRARRAARARARA